MVSGSAQGQAGTTWSAGRCLCPWQGIWNEMGFKVFSNPSHSMMVLCNTRQNQPAQDFYRKQGVKQNSLAKPL